MTVNARIRRYAAYEERTPHWAYAWVALIVSLLPCIGYAIRPPFSRLYSGDVAVNSLNRDLWLDYAQFMVFAIGLILSPANVIAAGLLTYAFRRRPWPRALCIVALVLALPACAYYLWMISN